VFSRHVIHALLRMTSTIPITKDGEKILANDKALLSVLIRVWMPTVNHGSPHCVSLPDAGEAFSKRRLRPGFVRRPSGRFWSEAAVHMIGLTNARVTAVGR